MRGKTARQLGLGSGTQGLGRHHGAASRGTPQKDQGGWQTLSCQQITRGPPWRRPDHDAGPWGSCSLPPGTATRQTDTRVGGRVQTRGWV